MDIEVTTVSRQESTVGQSPAAIYVITQEDIHRSGATTIPELFRRVPGMDVARIDAHRWAVSVRGFNQEFTNKLLVLMDGRAVYTPLFSGVRWEQQDTVLEDIDRIEVIRGPAAALWGANAVNGVINIITKNARDTQGLLLSGGGGTEDVGFGSLRYGGKLAEDVYYRVYAKGFALGDTKFPNGTSSEDDWHQERGGFRIDWNRSDDNRFTLQEWDL
jgi:iron complex outermembrane receptor protein